MSTEDKPQSVPPELLAGWLRTRSYARGLPAPVADHGGLRVDTGLPEELQRYVFASAGEGLRQLGEDIVTPLVFLKLCGTEQELRALLPPRWQLQDLRYLMTGEGFNASDALLPPDYTLQLSAEATTTHARIVTDAGELAASGHAAELDGYFIYDRIVTEADHRRRGLGACLMRALRSTRQSSTSKQVLVATAAGQALYATLGWQICSPYVTAHIP
ncbi:GNAT family N-acetyltransferase [Undibacterium sp. TJN19]|uniref:GNAT family N-acetyltransferase n=1 Tax=Undibacterium sp. TJN19 TaxID=3413055 RepID=UPI003BEF8616